MLALQIFSTIASLQLNYGPTNPKPDTLIDFIVWSWHIDDAEEAGNREKNSGINIWDCLPILEFQFEGTKVPKEDRDHGEITSPLFVSDRRAGHRCYRIYKVGRNQIFSTFTWRRLHNLFKIKSKGDQVCVLRSIQALSESWILLPRNIWLNSGVKIQALSRMSRIATHGISDCHRIGRKQR